MEALFSIDAVLETGAKSSTYKFALLTAILDYVLEHPAETPRNGFHSIPIIYLAKQVVLYYYPLAWYGEKGVKQDSTGSLDIYNKIKDKMTRITDTSAVFTQPEGIFELRDRLESNETLDIQIVRMLILVRKILLDMPIRYIKIGGGNDADHEFQGFEAKTKRYSLFGLHNRTLPSDTNRDFSAVLEASTNWNDFSQRNPMTWQELVEQEVCSIQLGHYAYLQLVESRIYIRDVIIKRWIEFSVEKYLSSDGKAVYHLINSFQLQYRYPERDPARIKKLREVVQNNFTDTRCMYCEKSLRSFDLDHLVPWSKYPVNAFWNLYPACGSCNSSKSDKVLVINDTLEQRIRLNLRMWFSSYSSSDDLWQQDDGLLSSVDPEQYEDYIIDHLKLVIKDLT